MKVLIAPDKFKGTLSAAKVARAIARGWRRSRPDDELTLFPVSDGGEGFAELLGRHLGAQRRQIRSLDAAHRRLNAGWWWEPRTRTAIMESAEVIGLAMLPVGRFHPFELDTFGLGVALRALREAGVRRCVVGLGGSATCDGGFGVARALGWNFVDANGAELTRWTDLTRLAKLVPPRRQCWFQDLCVEVDVVNPLLGARGAISVYGPQKGLRPTELGLAERCLRQLAFVYRRQFGQDFARESGAGAAGGLGFGLRAFASGRIESGFEVMAGRLGLERRLRGVDVVVTGEGRLDETTAMGKAVGEIARRCRSMNVPCYGLFGQVSHGVVQVRKNFREVHELASLTTIEDAKARPAHWLERLAARASITIASSRSARR